MKIFSDISFFNASPAVVPDCSPDGILVWPDSCRLISERPLFIPDFDSEFYAIPAVAAKIGRIGKCVAPRFAPRYICEIAPALFILPQSAVSVLKENKAPRQALLCFDNAIVTGDWQEFNAESSIDPHIELDIRYYGAKITDSPEHSAAVFNMNLFSPLLAGFSRRNTLKTGDMAIIPAAPPSPALKEGASIEIRSSAADLKPPLRTRFK